MTSIYFVRHAEPVHDHEDNRTRPLTETGREDAKKVTEALREIHLDYAVSSPYIRSVDTILECVREHHLTLETDERFRERGKGIHGNEAGMFQKRWADFSYCEEGGESLGEVQQRNIEALLELLKSHPDENVILGTHGTALSTILNYFDPAYQCDSFLRIIDFMPYIIRLDFEGTACIGNEEILIVEKEFTGKNRADR